MKKLVLAIVASIITLSGFTTKAATISTTQIWLYDNTGVKIVDRNITVRASFFWQDWDMQQTGDQLIEVVNPTDNIVSQYKINGRTDSEGLITLNFTEENLVNGYQSITGIDTRNICRVGIEIDPEGGENYTIAKMNIPTEFLINGFVTSANLAYKADYATLAESALKANSAEYATKANKAFSVGDLDTGLVQVKFTTEGGSTSAYANAKAMVGSKTYALNETPSTTRLICYCPVYVTVSMTEAEFKTVSRIKFLINGEEVPVAKVQSGVIGYAYYDKYDSETGVTTPESAEVWSRAKTLDDYKNILVGPFPKTASMNTLEIVIVPQVN